MNFINFLKLGFVEVARVKLNQESGMPYWSVFSFLLIESPICPLKLHNSPVNIQGRPSGCLFQRPEDLNKTQCGLKIFGRKFKEWHKIFGKILPKANSTNDCLLEDILFHQKVAPQGSNISACSAVWPSCPVGCANCKKIKHEFLASFWHFI